MTRTNNPVQFGLRIGGSPPFDRAVAICQAAESAGFTTASFMDRPPDPVLEGWTFATAIAVRTQKLILTHATLNVPFRNPALLAKMAATLDFITGGGRVELTLGAGGAVNQKHYTSYGVPFGDGGQRIEGLRDAVTIMRGLWSNETFTYSGSVYQVEEASIGVRPVNGTIPIWIGAFGPQMMRYTGRVADGWMKNGGWPASIEELQGLVRILETSAQKAGRDPLRIRRVLNGAAAIGEGSEDVKIPGPFGMASPNIAGSSAQILETVETYRNEGIDTFHLGFSPDNLMDQIKQFGEEVIAKVR